MGLGIGLGITTNQNGGGNFRPPTSEQIGRVVDVILKPDHPAAAEHGGSLAINGVIFRKIDTNQNETDPENLLFAYQGNTNFRTVPVPGEIVYIMREPSAEGASHENLAKTKFYWSHLVPVWNAPHHNTAPDPSYPDTEFGEEFEARGDVNPIQPFIGDIILEGRYANSIRLNGLSNDDREQIVEGENGKAVTLISNGRMPGDGDSSVLENINDDAASIYMVEDHIVPLTQGNTKTDGFASGDEPDTADTYQGSQVLINSGRLFFNAKEEGIFLSATEAVGINSGTNIAIDGTDYIGTDATKIYLGVAAHREEQPVLKGQISTDWMNDFLQQFKTVVEAMATLPPAPPAAIAKLIATGNAVNPVLPVLENRLPNLHSKKVYTE